LETCPYGSMRLETTGARILETCPWSIGSAEAVRPDELARALARLSAQTSEDFGAAARR
jgi:hypothetical protein